MSNRSSRSRRTAATVVVAIVAIGGGSWALKSWRPFEHDTTSWPANIAPLADFVERATGFGFDRPLPVRFVHDDDVYGRQFDEIGHRTDPAPARLRLDDAAGRALGLWPGSTSLVTGDAQLRHGVQFPAVWDRAHDTLVVHARSGQSPLRAYDRAIIVLLLTEMLQQQRFHLADALTSEANPQTRQTLVGLAVGHAIWVQDRFVAGLDDDDRARFDVQAAAQGEAYEDATQGASVAYRTMVAAPQVFGAAFIEVLQETDRSLVEAAFTTQRPDALDQLALPVDKYLRRRDRPEPVGAPLAPHGAERLFDSRLGPVELYLMLSTVLAPDEALQAADGWGNDAFTAYRLDGRVCVDARVVADSRSDAELLADAIGAWALARPAASSALLARDGTSVYFTSCDPGADVRQPVPNRAGVNQLLGRSLLLRDETDRSGDARTSECYVVALFEQFTVEQLQSSRGEVIDAITEISDECADES